MSMRVFNNIVIPATICPVAETDNFYMFYGHEYLKAGMSPVPFALTPIPSAADHLLMNESIYMKSVGTYGNDDVPVTKGLVRRSVDGNTTRYYSTTKDTIISGGNKVRDLTWAADVPVEVIYSCDLFDIVKTRATNAEHTQRLYYCSNIDSTAVSLILTAQTYTDYTLLDSDGSYVYILATMTNGVVNIVKVDKAAKTGTLLTTPTAMTAGTKASTNIKLKVLNFLTLASGVKKIPIIYLNASGVTSIRTINYDPSINTGNFTDRLSVSEYTLDATMFAGVTAVSSYEIYCKGDNIVNILHKQMGFSTATTGVTNDKFGITTLVLDHTAFTATNKGLVLATSVPPLHMIPYGSSMYVFSPVGYSKMDWDSVNNKYIKITENIANAVSYALDTKGYLWSIDSLGNIYTDSPYFANKVGVYDIPDIIAYTGTDITFNCRVAAFDMAGNKISAPVDLVINMGNAIFTSTGTKKISLTTSTTDFITVSITVQGPGPLKITPKSSGTII